MTFNEGIEAFQIFFDTIPPILMTVLSVGALFVVVSAFVGRLLRQSR